MVHRYLAGTLMLLIFAIGWKTWRDPQSRRQFKYLATALVLLIIFQALLGMWTVTLKLKPIIVMAHLLGGLTSFSLILWLMFSSRRQITDKPDIKVRKMRGAIISPDVPICMGQWWPEANFQEGFVLWREVGVDYEGGLLDQQSRVAIHLTHRIGAVITLLVLIVLAFRLIKIPRLKSGGQVLMTLVLAQFTLGVLNVALYLPLPNAVAHNAGAALLLLTLLGLLNKTTTRVY